MTALLISLLLLSGWVSLAIYLDRYGQRVLPLGDYDAAIVPGCAVRADGTPSGALERRTRHAIQLWKEGTVQSIVFTGGIGKYPPSEAEVAAKIATDAGVPSAIILRTNPPQLKMQPYQRL